MTESVVDNSDMFQLVLDSPDQLESAFHMDLPALEPAEHVVLAGMGGSAMAARAATAVVAKPGVIVSLHQGYGLPDWAVSRGAVVVACSYSGNTEETLSAVEAAHAGGLRVAAVTSGGALGGSGDLVAEVAIPAGYQPRAALGLQTAATIRVLAALGVTDGWEIALTETVETLRTLTSDGGGVAAALGRDLADGMVNAVPVIVGGQGPASLAAGRWATQIGENSKRVAFAAELPEMNHNLLAAMAAPGSEPGRLGVVALQDPHGPQRHRVRLEHTMARLGGKVHSIGEVRAQGRHPLARLFSLIIVGDFASVALADLLEVEAMPVDVLEDFKRAIASREDQP